MKLVPLFLGLAAVSAPTSLDAAVIVLGNSLGASCYQAAERSQTSASALADCDGALNEAGLDQRDTVATFVNRGIVHMLRREDTLAAQDFDMAATMDPGQAEAYLNKGLLRLREGRGAEAMPLIALAMQNRTARPALAFYARGIAHEMTGDLRAAYADLRRAQATDPKWAVPTEELARYTVVRR